MKAATAKEATTTMEAKPATISKSLWRRESMSSESWKLAFEVVALIAVAVSVLAGAGALIIGNRINRAQTEQLRQFDLALNVQKGQTARAQFALLELQQKLADRVLTDAQSNAIVESLKRFAGQEFGVTPFWDDPESASLGKRIESALEKAGWIDVRSDGQEPILGGLVGIKVIVDPNADPKTNEAASSLISALLEPGLVTIKDEYTLARNTEKRRIEINVGTKR
jgi:hypothetical protein